METHTKKQVHSSLTLSIDKASKGGGPYPAHPGTEAVLYLNSYCSKGKGCGKSHMALHFLPRSDMSLFPDSVGQNKSSGHPKVRGDGDMQSYNMPGRRRKQQKHVNSMNDHKSWNYPSFTLRLPGEKEGSEYKAFGDTGIQIWIPALPLSGWVILGKLLNSLILNFLIR